MDILNIFFIPVVSLYFRVKNIMPLPQNNLAVISPTYPPLQLYECDAKFSWASELKHLFSNQFLNIFWWPIFEFRQRQFDYSALFKTCRDLPGFSDLWKTIQKGSFAYNSLFLGITPFRSSATDLADITTLALFFGDEFIHGLVEATGKHFIRQMIHNHPGRFYMIKKIQGNKVTLQYPLDLNFFLSLGVMQQVNPRYGITYGKFHKLLYNFLKLINKLLGKLPFPNALKTADKIADVCNTCFESFLHDVNSRLESGNI